MGRLKPYCGASGKHIFHVLGMARCASSGGYYGVFKFSGLAQHHGFESSELCFSFFFEESRDRGVEPVFDVSVEVNELSVECFGESFPEGGFSTGRKADDKYWIGVHECEVTYFLGFIVLRLIFFC